MKTIATLGPAGSNHDVNARRYASFHDLHDAAIVCVRNFDEAFDLMARDQADFVIQACLHPQVASSIGKYHARYPLVDTFLGPTVPMGVLTHSHVAQPQSLGLMPTTRVYFDSSIWATQVELASGSEVARQLLEGAFDSGFTELDLAQRHPGRFRVDVEVGPVVVAWLVYGRLLVCHDAVVANKQAPVVSQFGISAARHCGVQPAGGPAK
jgi:hypothetical protein